MRVQDDPDRRCWKLEEWPEADRVAWIAATTPSGSLLEDGLASSWRPETRHKNRKGYGFWLHWLERQGWLDTSLEPANRVTTDRVRHYIADLQIGRSTHTVRNRIAELLGTLRVIAPGHDWTWLRLTTQRLKARAAPMRSKRSRLRSAADLFHWAHQAMSALEAQEQPGVRVAFAHRDALMIAVLASRPLRRGNLAAIEIGRQLIPVGEGFQIVFQAEETKNGKVLEFTVPKRLTPHLRHYLERFRPLLLKQNPTNRLWISWTGKPMTGCDVHHRVTAVTLRAFGVAISPHLFRDCVATSISVEAPEKIGLITPLLGHLSSRTGERHYNQAQSLETGRVYQTMIIKLRRELKRAPRRSGCKTKSI